MVDQLIAAPVDMATAGMDAANTVVMNMITMLPSILAAVVVFIIGLILASVLAKLINRLLVLLKFEEMMGHYGLADAIGGVKISNVIVKMIKIYVALVFLQAAVTLVSLGQFGSYLYAVLFYAPVILGAALIVVASAVLGEFVKERIMEVSKGNNATTIARASKFVIIMLGVLTGLNTAGFNTGLVDNILLTIVQAVMFGGGLAFGIAFGLGGQKDAQEIVAKARKNAKI